MKQLLLALLLAAPACAVAQAAKPDQYCILVVSYKPKGQAEVSLLTGTDPAKTNQAAEVTEVSRLENEADALNYLSSHGWEVATATGFTNPPYGPSGVRYCLRRHQP